MALPTAIFSLRFVLTVALFLAAGAALYLFVPGVDEELSIAWGLAMDGDTDGLLSWFRQFGIWGPVVIVAFMVLQMFLIFFPSWLAMVVAIVGYGPWVGGAISLFGVLVAGLIGYGIGQGAAGDRMSNLLGEERYAKLRNAVRKYGFGGVALFRVSPFLSTDAISIVAGAVGMPIRRYLAATVLGTLPLLAIVGYFARDVESVERGMWWLGGVGLVGYVLFIVWRKRKGHPPQELKRSPKRPRARSANESSIPDALG